MDNETKEEIIYKRVKAIDRLPLHYASVLFVVEGVYNYSGYYDYSLKKFLRNVGDRGFEAKDVEWLEPANASLQYAELKAELQRVYELVKTWHNQSDANEQMWKETVKYYEQQRERNKVLQAENESLKKLLTEVRDYDYAELMERGISALSAGLSDRINKAINPTS